MKPISKKRRAQWRALDKKFTPAVRKKFSAILHGSKDPNRYTKAVQVLVEAMK